MIALVSKKKRKRKITVNKKREWWHYFFNQFNLILIAWEGREMQVFIRGERKILADYSKLRMETTVLEYSRKSHLWDNLMVII